MADAFYSDSFDRFQLLFHSDIVQHMLLNPNQKCLQQVHPQSMQATEPPEKVDK